MEPWRVLPQYTTEQLNILRLQCDHRLRWPCWSMSLLLRRASALEERIAACVLWSTYGIEWGSRTSPCTPIRALMAANAREEVPTEACFIVFNRLARLRSVLYLIHSKYIRFTFVASPGPSCRKASLGVTPCKPRSR